MRRFYIVYFLTFPPPIPLVSGKHEEGVLSNNLGQQQLVLSTIIALFKNFGKQHRELYQRSGRTKVEFLEG